MKMNLQANISPPQMCISALQKDKTKKAQFVFKYSSEKRCSLYGNMVKATYNVILILVMVAWDSREWGNGRGCVEATEMCLNARSGI